MQHEPTGRKIMFRQLAYPTYDMLTAEISSFVNAIVHDHAVRVDGIAATAALALANRIETIAMDNLSRMTT